MKEKALYCPVPSENREFWKRIGLLVFVSVWIVSLSIARGQPEDELPPPPPENEIEEGAPIPEEIQRLPVAAPQVVRSAEIPEPPKTVSGVTVSPSLGLFPLGYDNYNIGGPEGGRYFLEVKPSIGIASTFKTDTNRTIDFSVAYTLDWREYYNKETTERDFLNAIDGSVGIPIDSRISVNLGAYFEYFFKAGADTNADDYLFVETYPSVGFQVNDDLKLKLGYHMEFVQVNNWTIDPGDIDAFSGPPSDVDDFRRGSIATDASVYDNFTPSSPGLFPGAGAITSSAGQEDVWQANHGIQTGVAYNASPETSLGLDYELGFLSFSNSDTFEFDMVHYIIPKITQKLPWEGGSITVKNQWRFRSYKYATTDDGRTKQDFRTRISTTISQKLNDYMGLEAFYRFIIGGSNVDDYEQLRKQHWLYMGMTFGF